MSHNVLPCPHHSSARTVRRFTILFVRQLDLYAHGPALLESEDTTRNALQAARRLCENGPAHVTDVGLHAVAVLRCLHALDLTACYNITTYGFAQAMRSMSSTTLRRVVLCGTAIESLSLLENAQQCMLTQLTHLDLAACTNLTDEGLAGIASLTHVQHLNINRCRLVTDAGVQRIVEMEQLVHLNAGWCFRVAERGVALIVASLPNLKTLDMALLPVADFDISMLRGQHLFMTHLNVSSTQVTDEGVARMSSSLTHLQTLLLNKCSITDVALTNIALLSKLTLLEMRECYAITDKGIHCISLQLHQLEHLNVQFCDRLTDESIASLATNLKQRRLRILLLRGCTQLTDASVPLLVTLQLLQQLDLRGCYRISDCYRRSLL